MAVNTAEDNFRGQLPVGTPTAGIEGGTLASSAGVSLPLVRYMHAVSGSAAQVLADLPYAGFSGTVALRPTGTFSGVTGAAGATATARGFGLAFTAVVGKILFLTYVPSTGLWYPSYTA